MTSQNKKGCSKLERKSLLDEESNSKPFVDEDVQLEHVNSEFDVKTKIRRRVRKFVGNKNGWPQKNK